MSDSNVIRNLQDALDRAIIGNSELRARIAELESGELKWWIERVNILEAEIKTMHDNGLGESWIENHETIKLKQRIAELEVELNMAYEFNENRDAEGLEKDDL